MKEAKIAEIDAEAYTRLVGEITSALPYHVHISIERAIDKAGKKLVCLYSAYPSTAIKVLKSVLGEGCKKVCKFVS